MATDIKEVRIVPVKDGPFKFYQLQVLAASGFSTEVYLNGDKRFETDGKGGSTSDNGAQDILKDGQNEILIKATSISEEAVQGTKKYFGEVLGIFIHGVNEELIPNEKTRIVSIHWKPSSTAPETIKYLFNLHK